MATAEHREPYEPRGSRTDLGAPGGESPPGDSTVPAMGAGLGRLRQHVCRAVDHGTVVLRVDHAAVPPARPAAVLAERIGAVVVATDPSERTHPVRSSPIRGTTLTLYEV